MQWYQPFPNCVNDGVVLVVTSQKMTFTGYVQQFVSHPQFHGEGLVIDRM